MIHQGAKKVNWQQKNGLVRQSSLVINATPTAEEHGTYNLHLFFMSVVHPFYSKYIDRLIPDHYHLFNLNALSSTHQADCMIFSLL